MTTEGIVGPQGPGTQLKNTRIKQHQDIGKVASFLGLSIPVVQALEKNDFNSPLLQDRAEVREYYKQYAKFLELEQEELLEVYDRVFKEHNTQNELPIPKNVFKKLGWIVMIGLVFGVAELLYWGDHKVLMDSPQQIAAVDQKTFEESISDMVMNELQAEELERNQSDSNKLNF